MNRYTSAFWQPLPFPIMITLPAYVDFREKNETPDTFYTFTGFIWTCFFFPDYKLQMSRPVYTYEFEKYLYLKETPVKGGNTTYY